MYSRYRIFSKVLNKQLFAVKGRSVHIGEAIVIQSQVDVNSSEFQVRIDLTQ